VPPVKYELGFYVPDGDILQAVEVDSVVRFRGSHIL
jgi:hypothetical protein